MLSRDPQQRPAGHQQRDVRAAGDHLDQDRPSREDVLEVVQDQQGVAVAERAQEVDRLLDAERLGDAGRDAVGVADGSEVDERDLVEARVEFGRNPNREPGLAHTTGPGERDQAHGAVQDEGPDAGRFLFPSDHRGQVRRRTPDPDRPIPGLTVGAEIGHRPDLSAGGG